MSKSGSFSISHEDNEFKRTDHSDIKHQTKEEKHFWACLESDLEKWGVSVKDSQKFVAELGKSKLMEVYQTFKICDVNDSGSITVEEFYEALKILGCNPSMQSLMVLLSNVDKNGNQEIEFEEYVFLYRKYDKEMSKAFNDLKSAFEIMDEDGNGFVTLQELKDAMVKFGLPMSEKEIDVLVRKADGNHDGKIDYVEFARVLIDQSTPFV